MHLGHFRIIFPNWSNPNSKRKYTFPKTTLLVDMNYICIFKIDVCNSISNMSLTLHFKNVEKNYISPNWSNPNTKRKYIMLFHIFDVQSEAHIADRITHVHFENSYFTSKSKVVLMVSGNV
jgi:hypothetical protein